jgi:16S rRNA (guanine527-N7)-methyltransferase
MNAQRDKKGRQPPPARRQLRASLSPGLDLLADRARALALVPVSRETADRLDRFVALLLHWQQRVNLVAPSTERTLWTRHIADSLQLLALAPKARVWADLGSGAGFPGLVIACALADVADVRVHLVETNLKKIAFLREAVRITGAPAIVHAAKIEDFAASPPELIDVVVARALAPLPKLLKLTSPLLKSGAFGVFPKGQDVASELTEASKSWNVQASLTQSRTDPMAQIVAVRELEPKLSTARAR